MVHTGTEYNLTTYVSGGELDISSQESEPSGIEFNNDGTKLFIVGTSTIPLDDVTEYTIIFLRYAYGSKCFRCIYRLTC